MKDLKEKWAYEYHVRGKIVVGNMVVTFEGASFVVRSAGVKIFKCNTLGEALSYLEAQIAIKEQEAIELGVDMKEGLNDLGVTQEIQR